MVCWRFSFSLTSELIFGLDFLCFKLILFYVHFLFKATQSPKYPNKYVDSANTLYPKCTILLNKLWRFNTCICPLSQHSSQSQDTSSPDVSSILPSLLEGRQSTSICGKLSSICQVIRESSGIIGSPCLLIWGPSH